uniref:non-specific serine/threonine protein kinase n=1 Tax=Musa acuminata subsp. malaccensis TaxID=214687 RepID=A0A804J7X3_MUSAM|nr:PREDICTED: chitin elicitor receptor kinase 1 isoform X1 [Musa acuminata subsp. malaccensis]
MERRQGFHRPAFRIESKMIRSSSFPFCFLILASLLRRSESACRRGCDLALASYHVSPKDNLTYISSLFGVKYTDLGPYNPNIKNLNSIRTGSRVNVFFRCDCIDGGFLGHNFSYVVLKGDTYNTIARDVYANLTTVDLLSTFNSYPVTNVPDGAIIGVVINCSCGDASVSKDYGLFVTYPLQPGENLSSVAAANGFPSQEDLLLKYNPGVNFSSGSGVVFIPAKDPNGSYHPFSSSAEHDVKTTGISDGAISGISIAGVVLLILATYLYFHLRRRKKAKNASLLLSPCEAYMYKPGVVTSRAERSSTIAGITVDKSVEFSYEELARATDDFSLAYKIGGGGFGVVYYAELRGEKAAIKKMDVQATKEFLAELKVLTNVHHLNLVRLIGYCTEVSLFLVYEFIENGNLSEHLRGLGRNPLPWVARVQIALDSARGLEYLHEHTVPVYTHRDIKSANILIDKNFHAKVADFGLAKLTVFGASLQTQLVGTFGYMPPEYAQYGEISPKVDVYAFGVVLYELISAKGAIVKTGGSVTQSKGLIALFEEALSKPDLKEELRKLIDPRLGQDYPIDSVIAMAWLAKSCTEENRQQRPTMRQIVVSLMTLSAGKEDWDVGSYEKQALVNLMSGR